MMFKTNLKEKVTLGTKLRPREVDNLALNPDFFLISLTNERSFTRLHPQGRVAPKGLFVRPFLGHLDNDHLRKMKKT